MTHAYRNYVPAFPKPKDSPPPLREVFKTMPDGREIIPNGFTTKGYSPAALREYKRRVKEMWERQGGMCCLDGFFDECPGRLLLKEATFEHEHGRTGGKRDDRIVVDGIWKNGAAHLLCNSWKGSRHIDYNSVIQARMGGK